MDKITIIGTGLIGASLGLAIKKVGIKNVQLVGVDLERYRANKAKKMGALDKVESNPVGSRDGRRHRFYLHACYGHQGDYGGYRATPNRRSHCHRYGRNQEERLGLGQGISASESRLCRRSPHGRKGDTRS